MIRTITSILLAGASVTALAADPAPTYPLHLPAPGGEVILPDEGAKRAHDGWRYAAARRVGDMVYLSGVIVYRGPNEGNDVAAFKNQARRALNRLKKNLEAANSDFQQSGYGVAPGSGLKFGSRQPVNVMTLPVTGSIFGSKR